MKKILLLFSVALMFCANVFASNDGYFNINTADQNLRFENIETVFFNMFDIDDKFSFKKIDDNVDEIGIRHSSYEQYYNDVLVEHAMIKIHGKNGFVHYINGDIMMLSHSDAIDICAVKKRSSFDLSNDAKYVLVSIVENDNIVYVPAYKKVSEDGLYEVYIDAITGRVIRKVSLFSNVEQSVIGTAKTLYNGWKNVKVTKLDGGYVLADLERNILTKNANGKSVDYDGYIPESLGECFYNYFNSGCEFYTNYSSAFCDNYLNSVSIDWVNSDWWSSVTDLKPDLFIKVFDNNDNLIYTSEVIDDAILPTKFIIPNEAILFSNVGYKIMLFDEDAIGSDFSDNLIIFNSVVEGEHSFSFADYSGKLEIEGKANMAYDVHWGMIKTYDYFKNVFNRISYDNNGSDIYQIVDPTQDDRVFKEMPFNAFALNTTPAFMVYGRGGYAALLEGGDLHYSPFVSLDVMAHEYTHLVTNSCNSGSGLVYQSESGALNESFSDIFAAAVEFNVKGENANWFIGEDFVLNSPGFLRSMENPKLANNPNTYHGEYWADVSDLEADHGGVHCNSGVQNYWFYLLVDGGSGVNDNGDSYNVTGIGIADAEKIAYRNLTQYLSPTANFAAARAGSIQAAKDLFGTESQQMISVIKSWYAVGVGEDYLPTSVDSNNSNNICMVYPTYTTGILNIISDKVVEKVYITNSSGQQSDLIFDNNKVDISNYHHGTYLINIVLENGQSGVHKIIRK